MNGHPVHLPLVGGHLVVPAYRILAVHHPLEQADTFCYVVLSPLRPSGALWLERQHPPDIDQGLWCMYPQAPSADELKELEVVVHLPYTEVCARMEQPRGPVHAVTGMFTALGMLAVLALGLFLAGALLGLHFSVGM